MKTLASTRWIPSLLLAMAWLPGGMAQSETKRPPTPATDTTVAAAPLPAAALAPATTAPGNKPSPPNVRVSPWTKEIVKLTEAGIEDNVTLSFIDNSGMFNLGADQIIYLKDLGVSSEVINAMLQHDQEVTAGVRALTITSDPPLEPALDFALFASSDDASKPRTQTPVKVESANAPKHQPLPTPDQSVPDAQLAALQFTPTYDFTTIASAPSQQRSSPEKKKSLYPVREPYPVELLPPIIFINAAERTPNTLVFVGFPRSNP